jgi:hypothetical protein
VASTQQVVDVHQPNTVPPVPDIKNNPTTIVFESTDEKSSSIFHYDQDDMCGSSFSTHLDQDYESMMPFSSSTNPANNEDFSSNVSDCYQ